MPEPRGRRRFYEARKTYGALALVGLCAHLLWAEDVYAWYDRLLAWLLLAVFLWTTNEFARRSRGVPLLPLITLQFYVMYGFAQFSQVSMKLAGGKRYYPPSSALSWAMGLAVAAAILFLLGHRGASRIAGRARVSVWRLYPEPNRRWASVSAVYGVAAALVFFVQVVTPDLVPVEFRNLIVVVLNRHLALILLLFFSYRVGRPSLRWVATAVFAMLVVAGFMSGMLENVIVPIYLWFAAAWIWGPGVRMRWIVLALSVYVVLSPAKGLYRKEAGGLSGSSGIAAVRASSELWMEAVASTWADPLGREEGLQAGAARSSGLVGFAQVVEWVPDSVPYNQGDGFGTSLIYFVPRVFWPGKPGISELINNRYAVDFGISSVRGVETSTFGLVQPLDGYWDFGVAGALLYPLMFGLLVGGLFPEEGEKAVTASILGLVFSAAFFQTLASLQFLLASLFSTFVGAWIAFAALELLARLQPGASRPARLAHG